MDLILIAAVAFAAWAFFKSEAQGNGSSQQLATAQPSGAAVSDYNPLDDLAVAWAHAEGWDKSGSLAQRNLNPVNLKGSWPGQVGTSPQGFAVFSDEGYGFDAADSYLQKQVNEHPDWTLRQLFAKILGNLNGQPVNNEQGNSDQEAETVATYLGIPPDTTLSNYVGS
ncbi:MAG: hypothetical protein ABSE36_11780 [Terracidiphilus sp.]|jgi:hypothetical protein